MVVDILNCPLRMGNHQANPPGISLATAPRGFFLAPPMPQPRSTLFIDGANWHYGLKSIGVDSGRLDYSR